MDRVCDKTVIVRNERECFACREIIKKGEKAHLQTNAEDGKIWTITICLPCMDYIHENRIDEFGEGDLVGRLQDVQKAGE